ncbi:MAG: macro domain-containing protein [Coleofasciculaceae cyanobacterium]
MLRYTDTTVFNVGAQTLVNTVNCVGVMGAGLALEFQLRFPEMEKDYVERCNQKKVEVGRPYLYRDYSDPLILNFPTKNHWKYPSKIEWIEQGLKYFSANYKRGGITSIAFPKLGCSNGGLEWEIVSPLLEKYLQDIDINVFICEDTEKEASGTEGVMVEMLNNIEELSWTEELGIRADIKRKIISAVPIYRFRDLRKVVGKQTYNGVFRFLYSLANCGDTDSTQTPKVANTSLFEEFDNSSVQPTELVINSSQVTESEEIGSYSNELNLKSEELSGNGQSENQSEELPEGAKAFHILLPYIEKLLRVEKTKDEIANRFELPKKLVGDWLEEAEKLGRIRKLSGRPVKYIATSSVPSKQLSLAI